MTNNVGINLLVMRRDSKESLAQFYEPLDGYVFWSEIDFKTLADCGVRWINTDI